MIFAVFDVCVTLLPIGAHVCESLHVAVKMYINYSFLHLYLLFYYRRSLQLMQYALWYTEVCFDRDLDLSRPRDVIGHVTIRFPTPYFL